MALNRGFSKPAPERGHGSYIASLTGLRGPLSLWIVVYHLSQSEALRSSYDMPNVSKWPILAFGHYRVDLFFMLSGFILMLVDGRKFARVSWPSTLLFYRLRLYRVLPLTLCTLLLILLAALFLHRFYERMYQDFLDGHPWEGILRTALLGTQWLPGHSIWNPPSWTLSSEMVGYAAFPVAAMLILRVRSYAALITLSVLSLVSLVVFQNYRGAFNNGVVTKIDSISQMTIDFGVGMLLARARILKPEIGSRFAAIMTIVAVMLCASVIYLGNPSLAPSILFIFGLLLFSLSFDKGPIATFLAKKGVMALGRLSFGVYVIHYPILLIFEEYVFRSDNSIWTMIVVVLGYFCLVLCMATVLHFMIERPSHRRGRKKDGFVGGWLARKFKEGLPPTGPTHHATV